MACGDRSSTSRLHWSNVFSNHDRFRSSGFKLDPRVPHSQQTARSFESTQNVQQNQKFSHGNDFHFKMSKKIAQLTKVIHALHTKCDDQERTIENLNQNDKVIMFKKEIAELKIKLQFYKSKAGKETEMKQQIENLYASVHEHRKYMRQMKEELMMFKSSESLVDDLNGIMSNRNSVYEIEESAELSGEGINSEETNEITMEELKSENENLKDSLRICENRISDMKHQIETEHSEMKSNKNELQDLQEILQRLRSDSEEEILVLQEQVKRLQNELQSSICDRNVRENKLFNAKLTEIKLSSKNRCLGLLKLLSQAEKSFETNSEILLDVRSELKRKKWKIESLEEQLNSSRSETNRLLLQIRSNEEKLICTLDEIGNLKFEISRYKENEIDFKKLLEDKESIHDIQDCQIKELDCKCEILQNQLNSTEKKYQSEIEILQEENKSLSEKFSNIEIENENQIENAKKNGHLFKEQQLRNDYEIRINELCKHFEEERQCENQKYHSSLEKLQQELVSLKDLDVKVDRLKEENNLLMNENNELEKEMKILKNSIISLQFENDEMKGESKIYKQKNLELFDYLEKMKMQNESLDEKNAVFREQKQAVEAKMKLSQTRVKEILLKSFSEFYSEKSKQISKVEKLLKSKLKIDFLKKIQSKKTKNKCILAADEENLRQEISGFETSLKMQNNKEIKLNLEDELIIINNKLKESENEKNLVIEKLQMKNEYTELWKKEHMKLLEEKSEQISSISVELNALNDKYNKLKEQFEKIKVPRIRESTSEFKRNKEDTLLIGQLKKIILERDTIIKKMNEDKRLLYADLANKDRKYNKMVSTHQPVGPKPKIPPRRRRKTASGMTATVMKEHLDSLPLLQPYRSSLNSDPPI